ncbi:MAG: hypothetical protein JNK04_06565 [Myxococcales bacterium]|nr:hypothetical protein [Myxococcales bacterium]
MRLLKRAAAGAMLALALGASTGCVGAAASSKLKLGEPVTSGEERYDSFFQSVTDVKLRADDAKGEDPMRKKVAVAAGLKESAKLDETLEAAKSKSAALKKDGGQFFVVVAPQPKLIVKKGAEENKDSAAFAQAIEEAIRQGIDKSEELQGIVQNAASLEEALPGLEEDVDKAFTDAAKRDQVKVELAAAKELLESAKHRAGYESGRSLRFVVLLASAVDSGAAAELLAISAGGAAKAPKPVFKGKWQGGGKGKGKGKPKNDFDP